MKLVVIAALIAVTSSAKLDRTYLPPASAETADGSHDSLQTPLIRSSNQGSDASQTTNPLGSYTNNFQGVVVDAAAPGTRASADQLTGLGGPRPSYGSTDSKVGDAAFRGSAGFRDNRPSSFGNTDANGPSSFGNIGFAPENKPERAQAFSDRNSNILAYSNDVGTDNYSYGFETDNGIAVGENGVAVNGIQAEGGYSYTGDDGQVYKVTYVADDKGYRPVGAHLPTPPPIPQEILKSLEKNAQDEAAGLVDDGSYDAQKYNAEGDYTQHNGGNNPHNGAQLSQFGSRPESDAITSGTFINQNSQAFAKPGLSGQVNGNQFGSQVNGNQFGSRQQSSSFQTSQGNDASSNGFGNSQFGQQTSQSNQFGTSQSQQQNGFATSQSGNHHSQSNGQGNHDQNSHLSQNSGNHFETSAQTTHSKGGALNGQHNSQFGQQTGQFGANSAQQNFGQGSLSNNVQNFQFGQKSGSQYNAAQFNTQAQNVEGQTAQGSNTQSGSAGQFNQFQANSQAKPVAGQQNTQFGANLNGGSQINGQAQAFYGQRTSTSFSQQQNANFQSQTAQTQSNNNVNKFSTNAFNQQSKFGQQPNAFGSNTVNGLSQSNRFETINQYLPPKGNEDSGMQEISSTITSNQDQNDQIPDFVPLENRPQRVQQSFVSASASASSQPAQTRRPVNRFPTTSNNFNNQATQGQVQFNSQSNSQRNSISSNGNGFNGASKPTVVPQTELTTPLEPNEESSQGSKFTQTTASVSNFGLQSTNNFGQPQQNSQSSNDQSASQTLSSSFPTQPQFASTSNSNNVEQQVSNGRPQFSQNTFGSQQNMKPSFTQRPDDSYHYNQPSKPFNTPFNRPQGSRFPSSTSQSNNFGTQNSQFNNQQNLGTTTKQSNPTLGSVSPTAPTQLSQSQGFQTNQFNGITQAAISPFPAVSPTTSSQFGAASNQFGSKPGFTQQSASFSQSQNNAGSFTQQTPFPSRPVSNFNQQSSVTQNQAQVTSTAPENVSTQESQSNQNEPMTQNQQYEGTIYEYNKPPESLPAPSQSDSDSSQTVQSAIASSQGNQITSSPESSKPQTFTGSSMIGQPSRGQSTSFGSSSASFNSQTPQDFNKPKPFGGISSSSQFSQSSQISQSSTSQGPKQNIQSNGAFRPFSSNFGSSSQGYPSAADSKPQFGLQLPQNKFSQNSQQTFGSQTSSQPATGFSFNNNQNQQTFTQTNTNFPQSTKPNLVQNNFDQSPQTTVSQSQYTGTTQIQSQSDVNANNPFKPTGQVSATASVTTNANDGTVAANTNFQAVSNQSNNPVQNGQTKPLFNSACCQNTNGSAKPKQPSQFGSQFVGSQGNVQSAGGNGEDFSGPKQPPSFDENGYHY